MKKVISVISLLLVLTILFCAVYADNDIPDENSGEATAADDPGGSVKCSISVKGGLAYSSGKRVIFAYPGEEIALSAGVSTTGRGFYRWVADKGADVEFSDEYSAETTFVMPSSDVELRAIFILPGTVMPVEEYVDRLVDVAENYKTLYVMGCFGAPLNAANKIRYINHHSFNADPERAAMIRAADEDTFGFDCVCLLKGILWGWYGDLTLNYGGAEYASNGVPDVSANGMFALCEDQSDDFNDIEFGEALWMSGHIGLYIGNGLGVECTPKWDNRVQITACNRNVEGYNRRNWSKHAKLPFVDYAADSEVEAYEEVLCTVRFVPDLDYAYTLEQTVSLGSIIDSPRFTSPGKVIVAWYTDEELSLKYDFRSPVTEDLTLYAKWRGEDDSADPDETAEAPFARGDVNRDGKLNAKDVTLLMKHIVGYESDSFDPLFADVNSDDRINAKDVVVLMRTLVGAGREELPDEDETDTDTDAETDNDTDGGADTDDGTDDSEVTDTFPDQSDTAEKDDT